MYAKLVSSNSSVAPGLMIRDMVRLLISQNPSTANLEGFSQTSSVIVDSTPAGWSYLVGSLVSGNTTVNSVIYNSSNTNIGPQIGDTLSGAYGEQHVLTATSLPPANITKYACLTTGTASSGSQVNNGAPARFYLTAATNANSTTGVVTNETFRVFGQSSATAPGWTNPNGNGFNYGSGTFHLIANARHITIIHDETSNGKFCAHWETSQTEVHQFYNAPPVINIQYSPGQPVINGTFNSGANSVIAMANTPVAGVINALTNNTDPQAGQPTSRYDFFACVPGWTIPATGVTLNLGLQSSPSSLGGSRTNWLPYLFAHHTNTSGYQRQVTTSATGYSRNLVNPIFFSSYGDGLPITFVTGVTPVYMMKGGSGSTNDTVNINGVNYLYFNVHNNTGGSGMPVALAMLTS